MLAGVGASNAAIVPLGSGTVGMLQRYTSAKEIGSGWLGSTRLALQHAGGGVRRLVAIKRIRSSIRSESLFHRCRALAQVEHHNLNRIIELGFEGDNPLVVSDYVIGDTLLGILARAVRSPRWAHSPATRAQNACFSTRRSTFARSRSRTPRSTSIRLPTSNVSEN